MRGTWLVMRHQPKMRPPESGKLLEQAERGLPVGVAGKVLATIDAPLGDVASRPRQHATLPSWHNALEYGATVWDAKEKSQSPVVKVGRQKKVTVLVSKVSRPGAG
jgi:hypothetical protein